jgi:hypothetical protein
MSAEEEEDIAQELFLDTDSEDELTSHDSDSDTGTDKTTAGWKRDTFCTG